jgi:Peptidase family M23
VLGGHAFRRRTRARRSAVAVLALGASLSLLAAADVGAAQTTALAVQLGSPARAVHGSDGREHIEYDLVISNAFTVPVKLNSILIFGGPTLVLALKGRGLADHTLALATPTVTVPVSSFVKTLVDVVLPRSFGRRVPKLLTERIRYELPDNAPVRRIIASTVVNGPTVRIDPRPPIRIASPLYGSGWVNSSGCCGDPTSEHRTLLLPADGSFRTPEMFAIDWIREVGGSFYTGDGTALTDWVCYGVPIHAVAGGTVVAAVDNRPEVPPFTATDNNRTLRTPQDFSGNYVVERIAPGRYAAYVHMRTGSVRVKIGRRLRTGQVIGRLGNSGNTTGPHLHFGIQDGPNILTSNSVPFEIGSFTFQGNVAPGARPGTLALTGTPRRVTLSEPLIRSAFGF